MKITSALLFSSSLVMAAPCLAQSLDDIQTALLGDFCTALKGDDFQNFNTHAGDQLLNLCVGGGTGGVAGGGASSSGGGAAGTQTSFVNIARRLAKLRDGQSAEQKAGGAGDDFVSDLGGGMNVFLSGQFEGLDKSNTHYETGYKSDVKGVTSGADFRFTEWFVGGIAVNYNHWDGNFENIGGFKSDSLSPILYAYFMPTENTFADIMLEYAHQWRDRQRFTSFSDTATTVNANGLVDSAYESNRLGANALFGYDHNIGPFTLGPRFRFRYSDLNINQYTETGSTGLEMRFLDDRITSLQTSVGVQTSAAFSTSFGVIVPQLTADWTHEFQNNQREMYAQFAQDGRPVPTTFQFLSDKPDRDFFHVGTGIAMILPNGIQPFINFEALVGNSLFNNYVGTIGIRLEH
jgi:uncharacterized protein YhjY with autotransporter beta-barrel domain